MEGGRTECNLGALVHENAGRIASAFRLRTIAKGCGILLPFIPSPVGAIGLYREHRIGAISRFGSKWHSLAIERFQQP